MDIHFLSIGERPKNHLAILLVDDHKPPAEWSNYFDAANYAQNVPHKKDITIHQSFHHSQLAVDTESIIFVRIKPSILEKKNPMHRISTELAFWCQQNEISYLSVLSSFSPEDTADLVMSIYLSSYRFNKYKTKNLDSIHKLRKLTVIHTDPQKVRYFYKPLSSIISGVTLCRDLINEPSNVLTPHEFAQRCYETLKPAGLVIETFDESQMEELGMHALLGVGQGSTKQSRMVVMQWQGADSSEAPVILLGKGVCFDTGGISLKPPRNMHEMKFDMGGAATVVGTMLSIAKNHGKINVVGIVGLVENMPDGNAQKPGDVVTSLSGQTIEILNTDAEGRLVLADLLWYAQDRFSPRYMIDFATLTGAIMVSLGVQHAGLFSNHEELQNKLLSASESSGERLWPMPMDDEVFLPDIRSDIADVKNLGGPYGGSITAAQFLKCFVNDTPWCHIDIAGTAWAHSNRQCSPKGPTGFGVRLMCQFLKDLQNEKLS